MLQYHRTFIRTPSLVTLIILTAAALGSIACGRHKLRADELERNHLFAEILRREDLRSLGDDNFFARNLLSPPYPEVAQWCAVALGRIGNPAALPLLYQALNSGAAAARTASVWAIGEIADRDRLTEQSLQPDPRTLDELRRLMEDTSSSVRMRTIEALGRTGGRREAEAIARRLGNLSYDGSPAPRAFGSLAITALIRLKEPGANGVLKTLAQVEDPEIQWRAENALIQLGDKSAQRIFLHLINSSDMMVRAYAARGLGICEDAALDRYLFPLLTSIEIRTGKSIPLPVRICAVQALGRLKNPRAVSQIAAALRSAPIDRAHPEEENFAIQAAEVLGNLGTPPATASLLELLKTTSPVAQTALVALAKTLAHQPAEFFQLINPGQFTTPAELHALARALAELRDPQSVTSMLWAQSQSDPWKPEVTRVLPSILSALARIGAPDLDDLWTPLLASHDGILLQAAARVYQPKPGVPKPWNPIIRAYQNIAETDQMGTKVRLINCLKPWLQETEVQIMLRSALKDHQRNARAAALSLLRAAGAQDIPKDPGPAENTVTEVTADILASLRKERTVAIIETAKGSIELELYREDAPLTVANFVTLAKQGFFNGLDFMRVIPFFAAQGGSPFNGPEAGSDTTIRCEINMRPFQRGSIGMALSGKDTGGSQFFITLAPQPHLDGNYTCFGHVVSGMQVVDRLVPGDRINRISIQEDVTMMDYRRF